VSPKEIARANKKAAPKGGFDVDSDVGILA
jgi:hypothetical protein